MLSLVGKLKRSPKTRPALVNLVRRMMIKIPSVSEKKVSRQEIFKSLTSSVNLEKLVLEINKLSFLREEFFYFGKCSADNNAK